MELWYDLSSPLLIFLTPFLPSSPTSLPPDNSFFPSFHFHLFLHSSLHPHTHKRTLISPSLPYQPQLIPLGPLPLFSISHLSSPLSPPSPLDQQHNDHLVSFTSAIHKMVKTGRGQRA
jgi:hypothetical protein